MTEAYLFFVVALLMVTVLVTIACASISRSRLQTGRWSLAKVCRGLGIAVAAVGILGAVSGLVLTAAAAAAPGITESDRMRIWSNGLAEAGYNGFLAFIVATPALVVAWRSLRQRPR